MVQRETQKANYFTLKRIFHPNRKVLSLFTLISILSSAEYKGRYFEKSIMRSFEIPCYHPYNERQWGPKKHIMFCKISSFVFQKI